MIPEYWPWIGFGIFVIVMLALDLGVFHRESHEVHIKEALVWCGVWLTLAAIFNAGIFYWRGTTSGLEFTAGYVMELSLSVDNLFVFLLLFRFFRVPVEYQHKVLFWGILGALVMRAGFIAMGISLIQNFHWIIYVFGAFLIYTGIRIAFQKEQEIHPEKNPVIKLAHRIFPTTPDYVGNRFFTKMNGRTAVTPLFIVLLMVETTDLIFAVDSVPAVLAITTDPFIVYTSNVFAILGLRSMFFALSGVMKLFHFLHYGLSAVLVFVGAKMLLADLIHLPTWVSLVVIATLLGTAIIASLIATRNKS